MNMNDESWKIMGIQSPCNNTQSWNTIVRGARKSRKLNVPSIENLANCERVLLVKSYLNAKNQMKSSIINWNCLNINIKQEITQKA